jgi:hypothetical protein
MALLIRLSFIGLLLISTLDVFAVPTRIMVRAKARDAKFIGTSMGGAYIRITDSMTGKLLSDGYTTGGTGSTDIIMRQAHARNGRLTNDETAGYLATLDIEQPVYVTISVVGPVNGPRDRVLASTQIWAIPGKHIEGDGIVLEIPGMIVTVMEPQMTHSVTFGQTAFVPLKAHVIMMCGCPISEDGLWDSNDVEVKAMVYQDGDLKLVVPMVWKETNVFEGRLPASSAGQYEIMIYAYNAKTGNTGLDKVNMSVRSPNP